MYIVSITIYWYAYTAMVYGNRLWNYDLPENDLDLTKIEDFDVNGALRDLQLEEWLETTGINEEIMIAVVELMKTDQFSMLPWLLDWSMRQWWDV
jgi:hypothetical protein